MNIKTYFKIRVTFKSGKEIEMTVSECFMDRLKEMTEKTTWDRLSFKGNPYIFEFSNVELIEILERFEA